MASLICLTALNSTALDLPSSDFKYKFNNNGYVDIYTLNDKYITSMAFAISGSSLGENKLTTSKEFTWTKEIIEYPMSYILHQESNDTHTFTDYINYTAYNITFDNNHNRFNWKIEFIIDEKKETKITHIINNSLNQAISSAKFWYIFRIPKNSIIKYGENDYIASIDNTIDFEGNFNNKHDIRINGINFDYQDIIDQEYDITNIYIGSGAKVGFNNVLVFAMGVTKGNGLLPSGFTLKIDPTTSSYFNSAEAGDPHADWTNSANAATSNNAYATTNTVDANLSISNFSMLESEGGTVPDDAIIQGIQWEVEAKVSGIGSPDVVRMWADISPDAGTTRVEDVTYHDIDSSDAEGYWPYGGPNELRGRRWYIDEMSNDNFQIVVYPSSVDSGMILYVDSGRVKISYATPATNNLTNRSVAGEYWLQIPVAENENVSFNNTVYYYDFENMVYEDTNKSANIGLYDFPISYYNSNNTNDGYIGKALTLKDVGSSYGKPYFHALQDGLDSDLSSSNFTMMAWVYFNSGVVSNIFDKSNSASPTGVFSYYVNRDNLDKIIFRKRNTSGSSDGLFGPSACVTPNTADGKIPDDTWRHLAVTYNGTEAKIYIDGSLQKTCTTVTGPLSNVGQLMLGSRSDLSNSFDMYGNIDEFMFFTGALTQTQIQGIMNNHTKKVYPTGQVFYNDLDIGTDTTINVAIESVQPEDTNITIALGNQSGDSYSYGLEHGFTDDFISGLTTSTPTNFSLRITLHAGLEDFITPHVLNNITVEIYEDTVLCEYDCSTTDSISTAVDCEDNDLIFLNSGQVLISANIINIDRIIGSGCKLAVTDGVGLS